MRTAPNPEPIDQNAPVRQVLRAAAKAREEYARSHGYFWLPCPLCDVMFSGHEWMRDRDPNGEFYESTIPTADRPLDSGSGTGICPACTVEGRGWTSPEWLAMWLAKADPT